MVSRNFVQQQYLHWSAEFGVWKWYVFGVFIHTETQFGWDWMSIGIGQKSLQCCCVSMEGCGAQKDTSMSHTLQQTELSRKQTKTIPRPSMYAFDLPTLFTLFTIKSIINV